MKELEKLIGIEDIKYLKHMTNDDALEQINELLITGGFKQDVERIVRNCRNGMSSYYYKEFVIYNKSMKLVLDAITKARRHS